MFAHIVAILMGIFFQVVLKIYKEISSNSKYWTERELYNRNNYTKIEVENFTMKTWEIYFQLKNS